MAGYRTPTVVSIAVLGTVVVAHGCAFNPFSTPDISERPGATDSSSGGSGGSAAVGGMGGSGGMIGTGGLAGAGGLAGQGGAAGTGGAGGAVCMCDGVDDGNECTTDVMGECPDGDMSKCHAIDIAKPCGDPAKNFICDLQGHCTRDCIECTNELGCTARCNNQQCPDDAGCLSGNCEQGVCCSKPCEGPCKSCAHTGMGGSCWQFPFGLQVPGCDKTMPNSVEVCNTDGTCTSIAMGVPLGAGCNTGSDCITARCKASGCVSPVDQPCIEDVECGSNRCDPMTHTCKPCSGAGAVLCRQGTTCLAGGVCTVLPGEPAFSNECKSPASLLRFLCVLPPNSACTRHEECESHHCKSGTCAPMCNSNADCPVGITCDLGWNQCKLQKGAFCIAGTAQASACQSGKCSGFPPRCE